MPAAEYRTIFFSDSIGVFQGGGLRGAAHVGAVEALEGHGVHLCAAAGASAGAILAAFVAAGMSASELRETLAHVSPEVVCGETRRGKAFVKVLKYPWPIRYVRIFSMLLRRHCRGGLLDTESLESFVAERLRSHLSLNREVRFEDLPLPLAVVVSDLREARHQIYSTQETPRQPVAKWVAISCGFPGLFAPRNDSSDGGIISNLPIFATSPELRQPTIAFRLTSDRRPAIQSLMSVGSGLAESISAGNVELQVSTTSRQVAEVLINTGTARTLDFANLRPDTFEKLRNAGEEAGERFYQRERSMHRAPTADHSIEDEADRFSAAVRILNGASERVAIIVPKIVDFFYELFPALVAARLRGLHIDCVLTGLIESNQGPADRAERAQRCQALRLGIQLYENPLVAFTAFVGDGEEDERAHLLFGRAQTFSYMPERTAVGSLQAALLRDECRRLLEAARPYECQEGHPATGALKHGALDKLHLEDFEAHDLAEPLRTISAYRDADISVEDVPLSSVTVLCDFVPDFKYNQFESPVVLSLFSEAKKRLGSQAGPLHPLPVVIEAYGDDNLIINGATRAVTLWRQEAREIRAFVIRGVRSGLPSSGSRLLRRVPVLAGSTENTRRYPNFANTSFRAVERQTRRWERSQL